MCDKKNNVLFTDTECVVLSLDFKLLDENQVLLRVPKKNNMYSVDLKNIAPSGGLTCLFAKATLDESNLWHRRLGHINFKTMNKLVKGNLVRGLPSKIFENDHTCVACLKGKQHKPLYDQNCELNQPTIQKFHMDLFGLTFVKSIMKKMYCLAVTDDFSRKPAISFMRPFRCLVTILNTLDRLGKFDGKADEGFFVGYSVNSKAFRVFNSRTKIVEENLHITFLENKPNVAGSRPEWIFDIDTLTKSMNYKLVVAGNQTNGNAGTKESIDAGQAGKKTGRRKRSNAEIKRMKIVYSSATEDPTTKRFSNWFVCMFLSQQSPKRMFRTLVNLPHGKRAIGTKWVYRNKKYERRIVIKNKARLVTQMDDEDAFQYGKMNRKSSVCNL
ncbi:putative ribonuclease H-like domain-containing protein [Tanacetum coccineum]